MTQSKKKLIIQTDYEMKTSQQLTMLHIEHRLSVKQLKLTVFNISNSRRMVSYTPI